MTSHRKVLVIGASGFLGSHLVKELLRQGNHLRVLVRAGSNLKALEGLLYEKFIGDVMNLASLKAAMDSCDWVFHSAVDTRAWLANSKTLFQTNVQGVINSVEAAKAVGVKRFVLTSSLVTIGKNASGPSNEDCILKAEDIFTDYTRSRLMAEQYVLNASDFPAVACCVSNTYGPDDLQPTPHGNLIKQVALGRIPYCFKAKSECVGVIDAAKAHILAAEKGWLGERYIISERYISNKDLFNLAADYAGVSAPRFTVPSWMVYTTTSLIGFFAGIFGIETKLTLNSAKMLYRTWPLSHEKAVKELGWKPEPIENAIRQAVDSYIHS